MFSQTSFVRLYRSCGWRRSCSSGNSSTTELFARRLFCQVSRYAQVRCVRACVAACSLGNVTAARHIATYPKPRIVPSTIKQNEQKTKKYNYLNQQRLIQTPRKSMSQTFLRQCDDRSLTRRTDYRRQMESDIKEHIRFYSPELIDAVFHQRRHHDTVQVVFKGNIVFSFLAFTRVYTYITNQLLAREHREELKQRIAKLGLPMPEESTWERYTDPQTGMVNVGLIYPRWLTSVMQTIESRLEALVTGKTEFHRKLTAYHAYITLHYRDMSIIPSFETWSYKQGAFKLSEIQRSSLRMTSVVVENRRRTEELAAFPRKVIDDAFALLTPTQKAEMLSEVHRRAGELLVTLRQQNLFAKTIALVMNALPEIRAIQSAFYTYRQLVVWKAMVQGNGTFRVPPPPGYNTWQALSKEEQTSYLCFARKLERRPNTGLQLFVRYCTRDYGVSRNGAIQRYSYLSGTQKAALDYPFYFSLARFVSRRVDFRRFVIAMSTRWGMGCANHSPGNLLFEQVMLKKWNTLSEEERQRYSVNEGLECAFPLQPTQLSLETRSSQSDKAGDTRNANDNNNSCRSNSEDDTEAAPARQPLRTDTEKAASASASASCSRDRVGLVEDDPSNSRGRHDRVGEGVRGAASAAKETTAHKDTKEHTSLGRSHHDSRVHPPTIPHNRPPRTRSEHVKTRNNSSRTSGRVSSGAGTAHRDSRLGHAETSPLRASARLDGAVGSISRSSHRRSAPRHPSSPSAPPSRARASAYVRTEGSVSQRQAVTTGRALTAHRPSTAKRGLPTTTTHTKSPSPRVASSLMQRGGKSAVRQTLSRASGGLARSRVTTSRDARRSHGRVHRHAVMARLGGGGGSRPGGGSMTVMLPTRPPKPAHASSSRKGGGARRRSLSDAAPMRLII